MKGAKGRGILEKKPPMLGLIQRGGDLLIRMLENVKQKTIEPIIQSNIADIFEALTASDRPYKKAKTLSESLRIMSFMRNDRHIDEELFDLFLQSGVYKDYAAKYLDPKQIDEVDINGYLSTS